jgi:hypothetical protein
MVGLGRVELPTYGLGNRRSIHLSYSPVGSVRLVYIDFAERYRTIRSHDTAQSRRNRGDLVRQTSLFPPNKKRLVHSPGRLSPDDASDAGL